MLQSSPQILNFTPSNKSCQWSGFKLPNEAATMIHRISKAVLFQCNEELAFEHKSTLIALRQIVDEHNHSLFSSMTGYITLYLAFTFARLASVILPLSGVDTPTGIISSVESQSLATGTSQGKLYPFLQPAHPPMDLLF